MVHKTGIRVDWGTFWGALFFMLIGGGFATFGGYQLTTTFQFMGEAVPLSAEVIETSDSCDDDGCTYWPTLSYVTPYGIEEAKRTRFGASSYGWGEGAQVDIWYHPDYAYVRVAGTDNLYLLGAAFFVLGMFPVVISFYLLATQVVVRDDGADES